MPRKLKFVEGSKIVSLRVPINKVQEYRKEINNFVMSYYKGENKIDTEILKKLLPIFVDLEVKLEDTTEIEDKRIMELIEQCQLI